MMDSFYGKGKKKGKSAPHYWGKHGGGHFGGWRPAMQGSHVLDAEAAMQNTAKVPPAWDPRLERRTYPFGIWLLDLAIWKNLDGVAGFDTGFGALSLLL